MPAARAFSRAGIWMASIEPKIWLKPGREKSLRRRHPWVFSGAIARVEGEPASGATVEVVTEGGEFLARAAWSPISQIRARVWSFRRERIDADQELVAQQMLAARKALDKSYSLLLSYAVKNASADDAEGWQQQQQRIARNP